MTNNNSNSRTWWLLGLLGMFALLIGSLVFLAQSIVTKKGPYFRNVRGERRKMNVAPAPPLASFKPASQALLDTGKKLYLQHCVLCHGKQGMGDGAGAKHMQPNPTPYVWGEFRYGNRYKDILTIITKGAPNRGSGMMAWNWLPEEQRKNLAHYVLYLSARNAKIILQNKKDTASTKSKKNVQLPKTQQKTSSKKSKKKMQ